MPRNALSSSDIRRTFDRLSALSLDPPQQSAFAAELVRDVAHPELVKAALAVLARRPEMSVGPLLREKYAALDHPKRDAGGFVRVALVNAIRPIALPADADLFERAATTYESTPQDPTGPVILRTAGLVALNDADDLRARLVAARMVLEGGASGPEATFTAVRVLAANDERALLYYLALPGHEPLPAEAWAECLRSLDGVPSHALAPVIDHALARGDGIVQLGVGDLLASHPDEIAPAALDRWLTAIGEIDVFRSVTLSFAAGRSAHLAQALVQAAGHEFDRSRLDALAEALSLAPLVPGLAETLAAVRERLSER